MDLARPELAGELERPDDAGVLGDVVGLDAEVVRDRGVRVRPVVAGVGPREVEERRPRRGRTGVAAGRAVGPDEQPEGRRGGPAGLGRTTASRGRRPLDGLAVRPEVGGPSGRRCGRARSGGTLGRVGVASGAASSARSGTRSPRPRGAGAGRRRARRLGCHAARTGRQHRQLLAGGRGRGAAAQEPPRHWSGS